MMTTWFGFWSSVTGDAYRSLYRLALGKTDIFLFQEFGVFLLVLMLVVPLVAKPEETRISSLAWTMLASMMTLIMCFLLV